MYDNNCKESEYLGLGVVEIYTLGMRLSYKWFIFVQMEMHEYKWLYVIMIGQKYVNTFAFKSVLYIWNCIAK